MALAVITSARKLRPYFPSHTIEVMANQPVRTVKQNTNQSGPLSNWAIELSEHNIVFKTRAAAKSQIFHVDGSSTNKGSGAEVQLQSPTSVLIRQSFSFGFTASNNEVEYKSLIAGLQFAKAVKEKWLSTYCDSQLVTSQFSGDYGDRNERMEAYQKVFQALAKDFELFELTKVPRGENVYADALAALGSRLHDQVKRTIPMHKINKPSIALPSSETTIVEPITEVVPMDEDPATEQTEAPDWRT
ncbi:PREDICTED: uncharacterized protein LOC106323921 [Brassica oleracea var. oleracea]|uniref:uncharacterized protein LOC106323921 n=1 Tax=Brassica oleracea var. oleracea TaxID=109376 RepID=UPI0006A70195|nr:PREDICTED: uncharacterized protein LOC106323921 [Brassica oleracea var. oleracea]